MKISVIVPIYNCEKYLVQCVESLIAQTYKNIEIILVNDGSTDSSFDICAKYNKLDNRICVIDKKNGGVSSARNAGIKVATGEYVLFVDADDWLSVDACEQIANAVEDKKLLYLWGANKVATNSIEKLVTVQKKDMPSLIADIISVSKGQNIFIRSPWAKVYKRSILEKCCFPEDIYIGEDACFLLRYLQYIPDITYVKVENGIWYNYRIIATSAVRRYKADLYQQSVKQYCCILNEIENTKYDGMCNIETALTAFCWGIFINLKLNENKAGKNEDCKKWWDFAKKKMRWRRFDKDQIPKFYIYCAFLSMFLNESCLEKNISEYIKRRRISEN